MSETILIVLPDGTLLWWGEIFKSILGYWGATFQALLFAVFVLTLFWLIKEMVIKWMS